MSFDAQTLDPKSEVDEIADVQEGPKSVTAEVPKKKTTRKQTTPKNYECQKCHRYFAYAVLRNNYQEKCGLQMQPMEEPLKSKKVKRFNRSIDEDWMSPNKLKLLKLKKDKMLKKRGKPPRTNKEFFMNHPNLYSPPLSPAIYISR